MTTEEAPSDDLLAILRADAEIEDVQRRIKVAKDAMDDLKEELAHAVGRRARLSRELREAEVLTPLFAAPGDDVADRKADLNAELAAAVAEVEATRLEPRWPDEEPTAVVSGAANAGAPGGVEAVELERGAGARRKRKAVGA